MKTTTLKLALITALIIGTVNVFAQRQGRRDDGRSSKENAKVKTNRVQTPKRTKTVTKTVVNRNNDKRSKTVTRTKVKSGDRYNQQKGYTSSSRSYGKNKGYKSTGYKTVNRPRHATISRHRATVKRNNRYHTVRKIDNTYSRYHYRGVDYRYRNGRYYKHNNGVYVSLAPPIGLRISLMPRGYHRVIVRNRPYYYYGGVFYNNIGNDYEVIQPPVGAIVPEIPEYGVSEVTINGELHYEYDNILYKPIVTRNGVQYKVIGNMAVQYR